MKLDIKIIGVFIVSSLMINCNDKKKDDKIIDFSSLLKEMTDKSSLTYFPESNYSQKQSSSWDRSQTGSDNTATWFANKDYNHSIREEKVGDRTEYVIMDAEGPGAITRWWIPQENLLKHRVVRIYLDGNPKPIIEENYNDFINGSSFVKWPFAFTSSDEKDAIHQYNIPVGHAKQVGASFYLPVPFAKSCKVTLDDKPFFYVLNYRLYEKGTRVTSFSKEDYVQNQELIETIARTLDSKNSQMKTQYSKEGKLRTGESLAIKLPEGENAIHTIQVDLGSKGNKQMNRSMVLEISFDDTQTVWSPLSEYFGGGVYAGAQKNYYLEVNEEGIMTSNWVMPYQKNAKITLKNYGQETVHDAQIQVVVNKYNWEENSMYFHAKWHEESPLNAPLKKDWNYLETKGKGVYVGDVLTIHAEESAWWGEGDEKIYIDGETFPSQLGTGLEDYYGYAWGMANFFSSPFISMPERDARGKDDWRGYTTVSRVRPLDAITYRKSLKLDMEAWLGVGGTSYAVTSFWYALPGGTDNLVADEKTIVRVLPNYRKVALKKLPGEKFPDPAENGLTKSMGNGSISHSGNHLDYLNWKNENEKKPLDVDNDNEYGTSGYLLPGIKVYDAIPQAFKTDSLRTLPDFIASVNHGEIRSSHGESYLLMPSDKSSYYMTAIVEAGGNVNKQQLLSFTVNQKVPRFFRLGIMMDNAASFDKVGEFLKVTSSNGGNSGDITLAKSNRFPDWYFFDLTDLKAGEKIIISGKTKNINNFFTLGGITFDINKK